MRAHETDREASRERPIESLRNAPYWAISALLHLILLLVLGAYVMYVPSAVERTGGVIIRTQATHPLPPETPGIDPQKPEVDLPDELKDVLREQLTAEPRVDIPRGTDLDNLADKNLDGEFQIDALGVGPGGAGPYGERDRVGRAQADGGPKVPGGDSVRLALEWLRLHQNEDGSWSSRDFTARCDKEKGICKNKGKGTNDGRGFASHDVGVTALAILAFTGRGDTHVAGAYQDVVGRAMRWLKSRQVVEGDPDDRGRYGWPEVRIREWKPAPGADPYEARFDEQWIYDHALATMAMAELLLLTQDSIGLDKSVGLAADLCLRAQNDGYGWRYGIKPGDNDTSVTGWMILALKACKYAAPRGIAPERLERSFRDALEWFRRATSAAGITGYRAPGDEGSRLAGIYPEPYPFSKGPSCMTAVAVLCRLFSGEKRNDPVIRKGVGILLREKPVWQEAAGARPSRVNLYYWYYATYALFQFGGLPWKEWNEKMLDALIPSQRTDGCERGSWDPVCEWGAAGGRVYATALGAMTLEVYYRYRRAQEGKGF